MKYFIIFFVFLFLLGCSPSEKTSVQDIEHHTYSMDQLQGKWVIVNYWASWCGHCQDEIPELNHFYQHNKDNNIIFLSVNYDHIAVDELKKMATQYKIEYPVLADDPKKILPIDEIEALPVTFVINPSGKLVGKISGTNTEQSLSKIMNYLMQQSHPERSEGSPT
ncbi:hypothetical protein AYO45_05375 [Gammaproteobacteria bacterium SCGC AG-212-F23]|nr:hypothetical protein AYO45_05375 [Gammaproteobacteria bacterium SCGC AG-212-F23]